MRELHKVMIAGTGSYTPRKILTNADLSKMVETSDEWILERTGIQERHIADDNQAPSDLGTEAARHALTQAKLKPEDIDMVVCATSFPDRFLPSTACYIQRNLGCFNAGAVDSLAACSGFMYALSTGWQYVATGQSKNLLVVGTETLSKFTNYKDRGTCILFGDGAGAVVLQRSAGSSEILHSKLGADGRLGDLIIVPAGGAAMPITQEHIEQGLNKIQMKGREVYKFAVTKMIELTADAVKQCGLTIDDISLLVPHQVNMRIIEHASEKLGIPMNKIYVNIDKYGNSSSASIPIALDHAHRSGRIKRGDLVVMVAFGGGLTWGSVTVRW